MTPREIKSWLMDMDGVLVHEEHAIPGANEFLNRLRETETPFLVLTNNSIYTRRDLAARLAGTVHAALVKTMENLEATCRDARARGETLLCGGLTGLGSLLYTLRRCRSALAE